jgi:hypothetical protein
MDPDRTSERELDAPIEGDRLGTEPDGGAVMATPRTGDADGDPWREIQARFVDDPRASVESADALVTPVLGSVVEAWQDERRTLVQRWKDDTDPSTEDLRTALQGYRSLFDRLNAAQTMDRSGTR